MKSSDACDVHASGKECVRSKWWWDLTAFGTSKMTESVWLVKCHEPDYWNLRHSSGAVVRSLIYICRWQRWQLRVAWKGFEVGDRARSSKASPFPQKILYMCWMLYSWMLETLYLHVNIADTRELLVWPNHFKPRIYLSAVHLKPTICWKSSWSTDGAGSQEAFTASRF